MNASVQIGAMLAKSPETKRNKGLAAVQIGRKLSAQLSYESMCFLMVLASRPLAIGILAICCEHHVLDLFGCLLISSRYAFCQSLYIACVSSLRDSRLALDGVWRLSKVVEASTNLPTIAPSTE